MNVPFFIARRYLFSRKVRNAINIITLISIIGICVSTAAMVIVLSAFNGIEGLVKDRYNATNPDLIILPEKGKTFDPADYSIEEIRKNASVEQVGRFIEETVIFKLDDQWSLGVLKGVDTVYFLRSGFEDNVAFGRTDLSDGTGNPGAIMGTGLLYKLGGNVYDPAEFPDPYPAIRVYALSGSERLWKQRRKLMSMATEQEADDEIVREAFIRITGRTESNPTFDEQYCIAPFDLVTEILEIENRVSGYQIRLKENADPETVRDELIAELGNDVQIKTAYDQNELIFATNEGEKKITFIVLLFVFVLSVFNLISVIAMVIIEKEKDIRSLLSFGFTRKKLVQLFFLNGWMVTLIGSFVGVTLGLLICWLQDATGMVKLDGGIVEAYPVDVQWMDVLMILLTVAGSGLFLSYVPSWWILRRKYQAVS